MSVRIPQVQFSIGSRSLSVLPQHIISFSYEDTVSNSGDAWNLEFWDPRWDILGTDILPSREADAEKVISFRYGWGPDKMSQVRYGIVTEFTPSEFSRSGMRVDLKGFDTATASLKAKEKRDRSFQGLISDVVEEIAGEHGWEVEVEKTKPIYELEGRTTTKALKTWRQSKVTDLEFINELAQSAESESLPGSYRVFFDPTTSVPTLHFHPEKAHQHPIHRKYVVGVDQEGEVISFSPEIKGTTVIGQGASALSTVYRDPYTRKLTEKKIESTSFKEGVALGTRSGVKGGNPSRKILPPQVEDQANGRVNSYFEALTWANSKATLEIVGDPLILPGRLIEVIVPTPTGERYFVSGIYLIDKATHEISDGEYTTNLELTKNAFDVGDLKLSRGTVSK